MTLGDFLNVCDQSNSIILFFLIALPLTAFFAGIFGKGEGYKSPWKYLYMILLYLACVPGIFAFTLNIYLMVFEHKSILDANIYTQILPVIMMIVTLWLIKWNIDYDQIPGFNKIGGLILVLTILISFLWVIEKTNIYVISFMPFHYFIIFFILVLIAIRFAIKRLI